MSKSVPNKLIVEKEYKNFIIRVKNDEIDPDNMCYVDIFVEGKNNSLIRPNDLIYKQIIVKKDFNFKKLEKTIDQYLYIKELGDSNEAVI